MFVAAGQAAGKAGGKFVGCARAAAHLWAARHDVECDDVEGTRRTATWRSLTGWITTRRSTKGCVRGGEHRAGWLDPLERGRHGAVASLPVERRRRGRQAPRQLGSAARDAYAADSHGTQRRRRPRRVLPTLCRRHISVPMEWAGSSKIITAPLTWQHGVLFCLIASRAAAQATSIRPLVPNPRREQPIASPATVNAEPVARRTRPRRARGVPRWRHGGESPRQACRRRDRRRCEGRCASLRQGLRLLRRRAPRARGRRAYALSHRLDEQAVHVDRGHAARRAGEARSRYGRQSLPRLQDSGDLSAADHAPAHHDALAGLRGGWARPDHRRLDAHDSARSLAGDAHSGTRSAARDILVVLELRDRARRLHRRAHVRRAIRRLHRAAHPHAARHDANHDASTAAGEVPRRRCQRATRGAADLTHRTSTSSWSRVRRARSLRAPRTWRSSCSRT